MKNKTALYVAIGALVVVLVGGIGVAKFIYKKAPEVPQEEEKPVELPQVDASVVVHLTPKLDGRSVILSVDKIPTGTESLEYELSYLTGAGLPKGAIGKISLNSKTAIERDVLLGTCSTGGKCTYDTGVTSVKLVLRFNAASGASQFTQEYPLR